MSKAAPRQQEIARPSAKGLIGLLAGMILGAVFLVAAWAKVLDPSAFVEQIKLEGLDFLLPATAVAFIALALELGLGSALVLGLRRLWVLVPSAALVGFFLWLTGRNYWLTEQGLRDPAESCGCFGNLVDRTPAEAFWQDIFLLVPPLLLAFLGSRWLSESRMVPRLIGVALFTVAGLVVALKADELPLDNLATRLRPGVLISDLCTGRDDEQICLDLVVPELAEGDHLVILADLEDEAFTLAIDALNQYTLEGGDSMLWVLASADSDQRRKFFWQWGPSFEIRETPAPLMQPLYRKLPRSFTVRDGEVVETFAGLPTERLAGSAKPGALTNPQEAP